MSKRRTDRLNINKGRIKNHKSGKSGGDNDSVFMETHTDRIGFGDLGNVIMDVLDAFSSTSSARVAKSKDVVSAYIEEMNGDYIVIVSFGDGSVDRKIMSWSSDATRLMDEIKRKARMTDLHGTCFSDSYVLVNPSYIKDVDINGDKMKIRFKNNTNITLEYSFQYKMDEDLQRIGYRRPGGIRMSMSFGRHNKIDDILG